MNTPMRLRAEDAEDLRIISACLQDAIVPVGEMCWQPSERRFVMVANRFKWEAADETRDAAGSETEEADIFPFERVHTAVRFENVTAVRSRGIDIKNHSAILELLAIDEASDGVMLTFAGGGRVLLVAEDPVALVEDLGTPWPTACKPCHAMDDDAAS